MATLPRYVSIDDIPGPRIVTWQKVTLTFDENATAEVTGTFDVGSDGPFIASQIQSYTQITATSSAGVAQAGSGLSTPTTIYSNSRLVTSPAQTVVSGGAWARGNPAFVLSNIAEIEFRMDVQGTGQYWTGGDTVPGASFYGFGSSPGYLGIAGWSDPGDRLQLSGKPKVGLGVRCEISMVFQGFTILNPEVRLAQLLGLAG